LVGIGILGTGVGIRTHAPGFKQAPGANLVALFSPNFAKAKQLGSELGFARVSRSAEEVCSDSDVDLVVVASPNDLHVRQVESAISAGKHVLCEKPLALTSSEAHHLVALAAAAPTQLTLVNTQLRSNPYFRLMRDIVASERLGRVVFCRIAQQGMSASDHTALWNWNYDSKRGGGVRWAMGSHVVDLAEFILPGRIASVFGGLDPVHVSRRDEDGGKHEVTTSSVFVMAAHMSDGALLDVSAVAAAHTGFRFDIVIYLEGGEISFDLDRKVVITTDRGAGVENIREMAGLKSGELENSPSLFAGSFRYFADEIVDAISSGASVIDGAASFTDGARAVDILEAVRRSNKTSNAEVTVPAPNERTDTL
jgi:predicted dehydrogenase